MLISYLEEKKFHPSRPQEITDHFIDKGINVKIEGSYHLFKYNQIEVKWTFEPSFECRGHILKHTEEKGWHFVSRPFDKFFNMHEGYCPLSGEDDDLFVRESQNLYLVQKVDGSLIQVWFDLEQGKWRASSSGTISPTPVFRLTQTLSGDAGRESFEITLEDLFWENFEHPEILEDRGKTYLFELYASGYNNVVTHYQEKRKINLLGIRDNETGVYEKLVDHPLYPKAFKVSDLNFSSKEDFHKWAREEVEGKEPLYGHLPEGFVFVTEEGKPLAKYKFREYVLAHQAGDPLRWDKLVRESFFLGKSDDILGVLPSHLVSPAEEILLKLQLEIENVHAFIETVPVIKDRKEYARWIGENLGKSPFQGFFFRKYETVFNREGVTNQEKVNALYDWFVEDDLRPRKLAKIFKGKTL